MSSRLRGLPRYSTEPARIEAPCYNQVRLALLRLGSPLRFDLPGLRTLAVVLDRDAWICIDTGLSDVPVLAWTDFQTARRTNLHEAISCRRFSYHAHARLIEDRVLQIIGKVLAGRLRARPSSRSAGWEGGPPDLGESP